MAFAEMDRHHGAPQFAIDAMACHQRAHDGPYRIILNVFQRCAHRRPVRRQDASRERDQDRGFVGEVAIERAYTDAGTLGDAIGVEPGQALAAYNPSRRLERGVKGRLGASLQWRTSLDSGLFPAPGSRCAHIGQSE